MNKSNFFNNTKARWQIVEKLPTGLDFDKPCFISTPKIRQRSKYQSRYWYTEEGVYRLSDHWGLIGSCKWVFKGIDYLNVKGEILAFTYWDSFEHTIFYQSNETTLLQYKIKQNKQRLEDIENYGLGVVRATELAKKERLAKCEAEQSRRDKL